MRWLCSSLPLLALCVGFCVQWQCAAGVLASGRKNALQGGHRPCALAGGASAAIVPRSLAFVRWLPAGVHEQQG